MAMTSDAESTLPPSSIGSSRKLSSWVDGFLDLTDGISSPAIFRKWAALSTIAGALERKVWVRSNGGVTYPHLYVLLVGGPGVGKTEAIIRCEDFLRELPGAYVAPTSISKASLIDSIYSAERNIIRPGGTPPIVTYNSLTVCARELGTFLVAYEGEFMSTLNDLFDNRHYEERKRSLKKGEPLIIKNPQLNMIAGTTPGWLVSNLPQNAWTEGFASRLMLIHGSGISLTDPFEESSFDNVLLSALKADLMAIQELYGEIKFEHAAKEAYTKWYLGGQKPLPDHPKLEHYLPRRARQLLKIAMAICVSRTDSLIISFEDLSEAMSMMFEAEEVMPNIFRDMNTGGDSSILQEVYNEVNRVFIRDQRPVPEFIIYKFISVRVPSYGVRKVFEVLLDSNMIKVASVTGPGGRPVYVPIRPEDHNPD